MFNNQVHWQTFSSEAFFLEDHVCHMTVQSLFTWNRCLARGASELLTGEFVGLAIGAVLGPMCAADTP